jgi:hypothetical protein
MMWDNKSKALFPAKIMNTLSIILKGSQIKFKKSVFYISQLLLQIIAIS